MTPWAPVGIMTSTASPEAKQAVLDACDARVGCAAVSSLADKVSDRLVAALPRTAAYVLILEASLHSGFRISV